MSLRARVLAVLTAVVLLPCGACVRAVRARSEPGAPARSTRWQVTPSFKYDALCFLNVLTGDPFYRRFYEKEYAEFAPRLTPAARAALSALKRKIKDENKNIVSAFLSLYFSADDGETLDQMLGAVADGARMRGNLKRTVYYSEGGWKLYESVRGELKKVFLFLKDAGFEAYWRRNVLPSVESRAAAVGGGLAKYDVVAEVEARLGFKLPSERIDVYVLHFARPHGARLTGARFITDASYPLEVVLRMAVHELLHPPYLLARDRELKQALDSLRADGFLKDRILHHDPSLGYNSFEGFVEEDCVRSLEQVIAERLGFAEDARHRFAAEDGGMHVLAAALYGLMRRERYGERPEVFRDFLLRSLRAGALAPGRIKEIYDAFYSPLAVECDRPVESNQVRTTRGSVWTFR
jgi:hypothetical protein